MNESPGLGALAAPDPSGGQAPAAFGKRIVRGYFTRWLVEKALRFPRHRYRFEDLRALCYERLRHPAALVLAAAGLAGGRRGESLDLAVWAGRVWKMATRFSRVPAFHYHALVHGLERLLSRCLLGLVATPALSPHPGTEESPLRNRCPPIRLVTTVLSLHEKRAACDKGKLAIQAPNKHDQLP